jgi:hypothetical protein
MIALERTRFSPARVMLTIARSRAHVPPKSLGIRSRMSMLSRPTYDVASRNAVSPFFTCRSVHAAARPYSTMWSMPFMRMKDGK